MIEQLPENVEIDEVRYRLMVLEEIRAGLESAEKEGTIPQAEAYERFQGWRNAWK